MSNNKEFYINEIKSHLKGIDTLLSSAARENVELDIKFHNSSIVNDHEIKWNIDFVSKKLPGKHIENMKFIWAASLYDGPMSGLCNISDEICWFKSEDDGQYPRIYYIYRLSEELLKTAKMRHYLFQKYYGMHCDYDESGKRKIGQYNKNLDYDSYKQEINNYSLDLEKAELIGWSTSDCNSTGVEFNQVIRENLGE